MPEFRVDASDFQRLFSKSSQVEPKLKAALRRRIRSAGQEIVDDMRRNVLSGSYKIDAGLRQKIAAGLRLTFSTTASGAGVRITSNGPLAAAWESSRGWRHPVMGNRDAWVHQMGRPYFNRTAMAAKGKVQTQVELAMKDAISSL